MSGGPDYHFYEKKHLEIEVCAANLGKHSMSFNVMSIAKNNLKFVLYLFWIQVKRLSSQYRYGLSQVYHIVKRFALLWILLNYQNYWSNIDSPI